MPSSPGGLQQGQLLGDGIAPVAALRDVAVVAEALHQLGPRPRDADRVPAGLGRLAREPVARQRRDHEMEGVRRVGAVCRGIGERLDDLELLDRRARPPVRDDERQRVLVLGADVDEVDVDPVDLGDEVRQGREALLELAPVVVRRPVVGQRLDRLELHALGGIHLPVGPVRRLDAAAQVVELLVGDVERERADRPWCWSRLWLPSMAPER